MPAPAPKVLKCPICRSAAVAAYRPFCSRRCADIDLGRWFTGGYSVAGSAAELDDDGLEGHSEMPAQPGSDEPRR